MVGRRLSGCSEEKKRFVNARGVERKLVFDSLASPNISQRNPLPSPSNDLGDSVDLHERSQSTEQTRSSRFPVGKGSVRSLLR